MQGRSGTVLLAAVLLVIQLVCWRGTVRLRSALPRQQTILLKRSLDQEWHLDVTATSSSITWTTSTATQAPSQSDSPALPASSCQPLPLSDSPEDLCKHIRLYCPRSGHLDYLRFYYCIGVSEAAASETLSTVIPSKSDIEANKKHPAPVSARLTALRILALICIILWMLFLFSWVGVVASDFFCPNLGTIAARLGLSESTAGVTFLAFGNGSPDVFSTFGAMRTGSGSLAIGELIGAASYIVSVISGSMMLIAPFRVKPYPFLRDVGFFTVAVATMMAFLFDGKLHFNECVGMIGLYFTYATTVIVGSWWQARRRRQRLLISTIRDEQSSTSLTDREAPLAADMERASSSHHLGLPPSPNNGQVSPYEYDPDVDPFGLWQQHQQQQQQSTSNQRGTPDHSPLLTGYDLPTTSSNMSSATLQRFKPVTGARHSLLGAVEFRDVVRSLQQEALADRSVEIFQSRDPERFLPHHHHHHSHTQSSLEVPRQRAQRSNSQRGHARGRSLMTFHNVTPSAIRSNSINGTEQGKPAIKRSVTTDGPSPTSSSSNLSIAQADQSWSLTKRTQPSAFDATAVAAAVGDPWKEHSASDGCEQVHLPSSSRLQDMDADEVGRRPQLRISTATDGSNANVRQSASDRSNVQVPTRKPGQSGENEVWSADWADIRTRLTPTLKVLFPSLGHIHEKSWLGIAVGVVTAPAILVLNLTLPVVDDEAETAALSGEKVTTLNGVGDDSKGAIRLDGPESDINAASYRDEGDDDDHIITLGSSNTAPNPWHGSDNEAGEDRNRRNHLQVASALRHLPGDASPLLGEDADAAMRKTKNQKTAHYDTTDCQEDDDASDTDSCDSHVSQSSHLFLAVAQCVFAPPFCVWAISSSADSSHIYFQTAIALLAGLGLALVVVMILAQSQRFATSNATTLLRIYLAIGWARVAAGFFVSILYIMTIVDEVVSILQTLGLILGLSDAILGLTVFAMGNSLGDLVANVTIARMGHPVMAISACFAGPLLNLLLGIGISGTWLLSGNRMDSIPKQPDSHANSHGSHVYHIDFSPTLTVSGLGLLVILVGTLIAVPLNGFYLNRSIGLSLIITYAIIMTTNVLVEIYYPERR